VNWAPRSQLFSSRIVLLLRLADTRYNPLSDIYFKPDAGISANTPIPTIKQEPRDGDLFVFGQYQNGNQLQRPNEADWPAFTDNHPGLGKTRTTTRVQVNRGADQAVSQAIPLTFGANQLSRFPRHTSRSMQAAPVSKPPSKLGESQSIHGNANSHARIFAQPGTLETM
jgi:hypothetical protein